MPAKTNVNCFLDSDEKAEYYRPMSYSLLQRALKAAGGQSNLARILDLDRQTVNRWVMRRKIPNWRIEPLQRVVAQAESKEQGKDEQAPQ